MKPVRFSKNDVPEENQRKECVEYFDGDDKRFPTADPADKLLNETFAKAQQIGFVTVGQNEITGRRA